jgi:hypothetical protein
MSQWAHHPWNLESPKAAPAWPVTMAAQPAKQEEAGGRCPSLVWKTSQLIGALGKWGRDNRSTWVTLAHQDWVFNSSLPSLRAMPHGLECPQVFVPFWGLDLTEQNRLPWVSRAEGGYSEAQAPVALTSLLLWPAGYITPWQRMSEEIALVHQCFLVFMKFWCC